MILKTKSSEESTKTDMMDKITVRKLNLLVHLVTLDDKSHQTKKALISSFVKEKGLESKDFQRSLGEEKQIQDLKLIDHKEDILFLALRLIQANGRANQTELSFYRQLSLRLGYIPAFIDNLSSIELSREQFDVQIAQWRI